MERSSLHPAPHGRLSTSLLDIYIRYKQDTRAIITWLIAHGPERYKQAQKLSIRELLAVAEYIRSKAVDIYMPEIIAFHFRQAISARSHFSTVFRKFDSSDSTQAETENHKFFTSSLTTIYETLCECCARQQMECKRNAQRVANKCTSHASERHASNKFGALEISCLNHLDGPHKKEGQIQPLRGNQEPNLGISASANSAPSITDDKFGKALELYQVVQDIEKLLTATTNAWGQAARQEIPLVVATSVASTAYAAFENVEHRLVTACDLCSPGDLTEACEGTYEVFSGDENKNEHSNDCVRDLYTCWQHLLALKGDGPAALIADEREMNRMPSYVTLRKGLLAPGANNDCCNIMLHSIVECIKGRRLYNTLIRTGTPVFAEIGFFLTHETNPCNSFHCSIGLALVLKSYESYCFAQHPSHSPSSCRLQTLRFAQAVLPSITAVLDDPTMPCRCNGTLAYHLENLQSDFKSYLREKQFDFFFQSPWVCGSHILEMMHALHYYGLRLVAYKSFMGSVVYIYNVLRQFAGLGPVQVLEDLSSTLDDLFFPGGRPFRNFKASYLRYMGCRLRFHSKSSGHRSGCHSLAIPAHTAKATAGFSQKGEGSDPRFDCGRKSLLYHIKLNEHRLGDTVWNRVQAYHASKECCSTVDDKQAKDKGRRSTNYSPRSHLSNCMQHTPSSIMNQDCLQNLQDALTSELTGSFPVAKLNLFKVYLACARIVCMISDKYHGDTVEPGQYCLCSAEALLAAADRFRENEHKGSPFGFKGLVSICKEAIVQELGGRKSEEFIWENV